jgi:hypothetical protein
MHFQGMGVDAGGAVLPGLPGAPPVAGEVEAVADLPGEFIHGDAKGVGQGDGGHWSTKSRRYSTTMGALRRARVAFAKRRRARDGVPLDAWDRPEDDDQVVIVASWVYVGAGYATEGERWLALSAAARAREQRRIAREELTTTTRSAA